MGEAALELASGIVLEATMVELHPRVRLLFLDDGDADCRGGGGRGGGGVIED